MTMFLCISLITVRSFEKKVVALAQNMNSLACWTELGAAEASNVIYIRLIGYQKHIGVSENRIKYS